jgi:alpha-aminoadipate/glutamate carrier protein LysW
MLHGVTLANADLGKYQCYNPKTYRVSVCRAGTWHVLHPIAKPNAGTKRAEERMATCPECDAEIEVDEFDVDKGDLLSCPECGSNLEVTGLSPIELDLASEDDEDDDDDADEDGEVEEDADDDDDDDEEEEDLDE